jgi:hypothetical protein
VIVSLLALALATAVGVACLGPVKGLVFVLLGLALSAITGFLGAFTGGWITGRARKERLDKEQMTRSLVAGHIATAFLRGFLFAWLVLWLSDLGALAFYGPLLVLAWFWSLRVLGDLSLSYGLHFLGPKQREAFREKLLRKRLEFLEANGRIETRALAGTAGFALVLATALAWQRWGRS